MKSSQQATNPTRETAASNDSSRANRVERAGQRRVSPRRITLIILVVALAVTTGGWITSFFVTTPAELAAKAAPPAPSTITAAVESRIVEDAVITRGTVTAPTQTNALANRSIDGAKIAIVTRLPLHAGDSIESGQLAVELSGRPIIALPGSFPAYRDLAAGATGPDVAQLQAALTSLKFSIGRDKQGIYGDGTGIAVGQLYKSLGYPPQTNAPMSELLFLSSFPARVSSSTALVGSDAASATLDFSTGALAVYVPSDAELERVAKTGDKVQITSELLNESVDGIVSGRASSPTPSGTTNNTNASSSQPSGQTSSIVVTPNTALDATWSGQDVRVKFVNGATTAAVTAVPIAAIYSNSSGQLVVTVRTHNKKHQIVVTTGVTGEGYAEITSSSAPLKVGDQVVVGEK